MQINKTIPLIALTLALGLAEHSRSQDWNAIHSIELDAEYYMLENSYDKAAETYLKALQRFPESANLKFKIGYCYLKTDDRRSEALPYLEEAAQKVSEGYDVKSLKEAGAPPEVLYHLGIAHTLSYNFDKATTAFNRYKKYLKPENTEIGLLVEQHLQNCTTAQRFISSPIGLSTKSIGEQINSDLPNFNAVISGDGQTMAYTTRTTSGNRVFIAKLEGDTWGKPLDISGLLGRKSYKTSFLSYEGQTLYLIEEAPENSEIVVSLLQKGRWSKPKRVARPISSKHNEGHIITTKDGNTAYFTSDREGGLGGFDIYKTTLAGGKWSDPENLGASINTPLNEVTPFLTPDEKYLFFSSEGHDNVGGYDILYVNLEGSPSVKNLGYPLNTPDNNVFYQPTSLTTGHYPLLSPHGSSSLDIHSVEIATYADLILNIALAEDAPLDKPHNLTITDLGTGKVIHEKSSRGAVQYIQEIMPGSYSVTAGGEGFQTTVNSIEIPDNPTPKEHPVSIVLNGVEAGAAPTLAAEVPPAGEGAGPIAPGLEKANPAAAKKEIPQREAEKPTPKPIGTKPLAATNFSKSTATPAPAPTSYSVQLYAVRKPLDIASVGKFDSLFVTVSPQGYYRYSVGNTQNVQEAEAALASLRAKGVSNAYVRINQEHPGYTIQIAALSNPKKLGQFKNIANLMVYKGNDGLYRYCVGKYASPHGAQDDLDALAGLGYGNAFVRLLGQ